jgi:acetone carboxylase gamma subunit
MQYELFSMPSDDGDTPQTKVEGFDLARSAVNIAAGTLDYMLARVGKSLSRIDGYDNLSSETQSFVHEIMFMLMLEELSRKFADNVRLPHGDKLKCHSKATREISDCDLFVKILNKASSEPLENAIIARNKEEALEVIRRHLESDQELPTLLSWESMRLENPFPKKP